MIWSFGEEGGALRPCRFRLAGSTSNTYEAVRRNGLCWYYYKFVRLWSLSYEMFKRYEITCRKRAPPGAYYGFSRSFSLEVDVPHCSAYGNDYISGAQERGEVEIQRGYLS